MLVVAFSDPGNIFVRDDLSFLTRSKIQQVIATETAIQNAIEKYYGGKFNESFQDSGGKNIEEFQIAQNASKAEIVDAASGGDDSPIIKFVNLVLTEAIRKKVSDIHIEPYEKTFRVRFRVDGSLVQTTQPPPGAAAAVVSRIKIMAKLDIAEKRRPQDGRIKVRMSKGSEIDFRVSVLPTLWGEKIVMRLLDQTNLQLDMTKLGFEPEDLGIFKEVLNLPQGMLLITGPTGSGKTTTIYSALAELNKPDVNICTAEDPVEFNLEGINQVQMNSEIDLTFASALRSFLRQDPDIVMVGEIRDLETAEISFKAASTGHLVVSTLHTNDAPATVSRLTEMGIAPYVVTSTLSLIVAQRLVGKICENCKTRVDVKPQVLLDLGIDEASLGDYSEIFHGKGCGNCNNTGIKGRIAIFEIMKMTDRIREIILDGGNALELRKMAKLEGLRTLRRSALLMLKRGQTSIAEVVNSSVRDT
jgi:type IV pilus assembly protein PilB